MIGVYYLLFETEAEEEEEEEEEEEKEEEEEEKEDKDKKEAVIPNNQKGYDKASDIISKEQSN